MMPILSLYSGLLGLILIYLSYNVVKNRQKYEVGIGDGGNNELNRAIRVHANFIEYVPLALVLLAVFESNHGHPIVAHVAGAVLVLARLMHAYGLGRTVGVSKGRFIGILLTWIVIIALSGFNLYYFILLNI